MNNRPRPQFISTRTATFTSAGHDEVQLVYPHQGLADDKDNGKRTLVFYDHERYAAKQAEHGRDVYPEPTPFNSI